MLNYEFHENKETEKMEYSFTGLDFEQAYFISLSLDKEIERLHEKISSYKLRIEQFLKRDTNDYVRDNVTVGEHLELCYSNLEGFEKTLLSLEEMYNVLEATHK